MEEYSDREGFSVIFLAIIKENKISSIDKLKFKIKCVNSYYANG
ncbi:hypothetical protein [Anaeromicrobium sediminis]|nr:hypothetical protein [Anaeromicrobium sediminis]